MYKLEFPTQEEINKLEISAEKPYLFELDYKLPMSDVLLPSGVLVSTWIKTNDKYVLVPNLSFKIPENDPLIFFNGEISDLMSNLSEEEKQELDNDDDFKKLFELKEAKNINHSELYGEAVISLINNTMDNYFAKTSKNEISIVNSYITTTEFANIAEEMKAKNISYQELTVKDIIERERYYPDNYPQDMRNSDDYYSEDNDGKKVKVLAYRGDKLFKAFWEKYLPNAVFTFKLNS